MTKAISAPSDDIEAWLTSFRNNRGAPPKTDTVHRLLLESAGGAAGAGGGAAAAGGPAARRGAAPAGPAAPGPPEMPLPDNTLPMMTGFGQYGPLEMGGMFSVVKVREGLAADDYKDPGPYKHPAGTVARQVTDAPAPQRRSDAPSSSTPAGFTVVKPGSNNHNSH